MDDENFYPDEPFLLHELTEETWVRTWLKSADALDKSALDWIKRGDYLQAGKCQTIGETYRAVAHDMRAPRYLRIEREKGIGYGN